MKKTTLLLIIAISMICVTQSNGQDPRRQQRRALVEDLLRGLIESQTTNPPADPRQNARPDMRPANPRPGQVNPRPLPRPNTNRPVTIEVSREMLSARQHLESWNSACGSLVEELRHHEYESPQLRPLLADALRVQANVQLLSRKAQIYPSVDPLVGDFQTIDRDWRVLSQRLKQTRGIPAECAGFIQSITDLDTKMCGLFGIQPQINRVELQRLATRLSSDFDHLLNDAYYLVRNKQGGRKLINRGKSLQSMISQASALIGRADYETIVDAYRQCTANWKPFSQELIKLRDERLRHSITDIETTGRLINEQLWLPVEIDRNYLAGMASSISTETNHIFDDISMSRLLKMDKPGIVLATAREFQHACANFANGISSGAPVQDLEWDFRLFEVQWNQVHDIFHEFHIANVDNHLEDIQFSMNTLKQSFGDAPGMDPVMMAQITAQLDALGRQTSLDVHRRITDRRYDRGFHDMICGEADRFNQSANQLHQLVLRNPNSPISRNDLNNLFVQWRTLKPMFNKCKEQDRNVLNQYRSQIEPLMVKLQVVYAE